MATIRRYGPSLVSPEVSPRPELGRGNEAAWATINDGFKSVNEFLKPAVIHVRTTQGEAEALEAVDQQGPEFKLERVVPEGQKTALVPGGLAENPIGADGLRVGPTRERAGLGGQLGPTRNRADAMFGTVDALIADAAARHGVPEDYLRTIVFLESGGDPAAQNSTSSAGGLFQFTDGTAQQYGLGNRMDAGESADAGARLTHDNMTSLANALGRQPSVGEVYLAHQQGIGGAIALLSNPSANVADVLDQFYDDPTAAITNNGGNVNMTAGEFAGLWVNRANEAAGQPVQFATTNGLADYELRVTNENSFEPRLPFTVRDAAFNAAADRAIGARAQEALETGMQVAAARANGDLEVLRREMETVRSTVMGQLPNNLPGLRTDLETAFTRGMGVAERGAIELMTRRTMAAQADAQATTQRSIQSEAERLALTGGTSQEISAHMAQSQNALAAFGPREGFTVNGQEYPPDLSRAGTMTATDIATSIASVGDDARRIMILGEFGRSRAPGAFVDEFRRQVYAGASPLPAGESLQLLAQMDAQVRQAESQRRTVAEAERKRLQDEATTTINNYVALNEAGVPVSIPAAERATILRNLSPYPELQREAEIEFAVADASVATFGMNGPQLLAYTGQVRADIAAAAARGELDLEGAAVIASLEDRVKKISDAVTAEMIGLPMVEQLALDGARADDIDWDGLRAQAAGNADVLAEIAEVEDFYRKAESLDGMSADERDMALEVARDQLRDLARMGTGFGSQAATAVQVLDRLDEWSGQRQTMASDDPVRFAASAGVTLPSFEGAQNMGDIGAVLSQRVGIVAPMTAPEGVTAPVPLSGPEVEAIAEVYRSSTMAEKTAFLGSVADLGAEQSAAVFARFGMAEPTLYAAGEVYAGGNRNAAGVILRGSVDAQLSGGTEADRAEARTAAIGTLFASVDGLPPIISEASIAALDTAALAYARGAAVAAGRGEISADDLQQGYLVAMGAQEDGTGGYQETRFGATVMPPGWDGRRFNRIMRGFTQETFEQYMGGPVTDVAGRVLTVGEFNRTVTGMRLSSADPTVLVPLDQNGGAFRVNGRVALFNLGEW